MLYDLISGAQNGDKDAMVKLIDRFQPLLKKYAAKLRYEDAYEDTVLFFIEFIKCFNLKSMNSLKDEVIVSYINTSIINFYNKKIQKLIERKKEIVISDLTREQAYYTEVRLAKEDKTDIFVEWGFEKKLNQNEYRIIYMVYIEGYSVAEIVRTSNKSRQAVNQIKRRALKKLKNFFCTFL